MTRGRTPLAGTELVKVEPSEAVVAQDLQAADQYAVGQAMVMDATEVLKMVGRIEMGNFVATVADRAIAETYVKVKNSKAYKGLPYRTPDGKVATVATLEEFCEAFMPRSHRRCQELAANLQLLGPDLYEQAEAIGFRQRDYAALKALPADDQIVVKQAIEAGKLDNAIELMQDMAARHKHEKDALDAELKEAKAYKETAERQIAAKDKKINELDAKLSKPRAAVAEYDEAAALAAWDSAVLHAVAAIHAPLRRAILDLLADRTPYECSRTVRQAIAAGLGRVGVALKDVSADMDVAPNEDADASQAEDEIDKIWALTNADLAAEAGVHHADASE